MSKEVVASLQNSLAENEQVRKRQLAAFGVLFLAMLSVLLWIGHLAGHASTDIRTMVVWVVIATVVAICYGALALALYINRMAARLLKTLARISGESKRISSVPRRMRPRPRSRCRESARCRPRPREAFPRCARNRGQCDRRDR